MQGHNASRQFASLCVFLQLDIKMALYLLKHAKNYENKLLNLHWSGFFYYECWELQQVLLIVRKITESASLE